MKLDITVAGLGPGAGIRCSELMGHKYCFAYDVGNEMAGHSR
jgi:hypothetical protein